MEKRPISVNINIDISKISFGGVKVENNGTEILTISKNFDDLSNDDKLKVYDMLESLIDVGRDIVNGSN